MTQDKCEYFIYAAEAFLGADTGSARHANIVKFYNEITPLPRGYRLKSGDAWCAAFVSAVGYIVALVPDIIKPECGAQEMYNSYPAEQKKRGGENTRRGDLVFYDWNGDGRIDHVGICIFGEDNGKEALLCVLEGNYENTVQYRYIKPSDPAIYGSARPDFGEVNSKLFVTCDSLNLRDLPSMDGDIIAEMTYGETVSAVNAFGGNEVDGWAYVTFEGKTGYCGADYLSETPPPAVGKTTTALNIRKAAGTSAKILRVLPSGTEFDYTGDQAVSGGEIWERVYVPQFDLTGWLNLKYTKAIR